MPSVKATDDAGKVYWVGVRPGDAMIIRSFVDSTTVPGQPELWTQCGHQLRRVSRGVYVIAAAGVTIRSDDPDAP